ncbi:MAG: M14 family zinc carboxypeptidase [Planctomycetota bacterium]|jgi:hypothetical protein
MRNKTFAGVMLIALLLLLLSPLLNRGVKKKTPIRKGSVEKAHSEVERLPSIPASTEKNSPNSDDNVNRAANFDLSGESVQGKIVLVKKQNDNAQNEKIQDTGCEIIEDYENFVLVKSPKSGSLDGLPVYRVYDPNRLLVNGYTLDTASAESQPAGVSSDMLVAGKRTDFHILQFIGPVKKEWRDAVNALGVEAKGYYHNFAVLVRASSEELAAARKLRFINSSVPYHPAFRLAKWIKPFEGKKLFNLQTFSINVQANVMAAATAAGIDVSRIGRSDFQAMASYQEACLLARLEGVEWIDEARLMAARNDEASWQCQSGYPDFRPVWDKGLHGEGQLAGISDSGLDYDHESFRDPLQPVPLSTESNPQAPNWNHRKVINYWKCSWGDWIDQSDHGTHCSGTIVGDNSYLPENSGNPNGLGMAPKAKISFTDLKGSSWPAPTYSNIDEYFLGGVRDGSHVFSCSWGELSPPPGAYTGSCRGMDEVAHNNRYMLILNAQGNKGTCDAPAPAKNIISVSGSGDCVDGRLKPDIEADRSLTSADSDGDPNTNNSGYRAMSGTSMACPTVAGCVLLVRQYFTEGWYPSGAKNPSDGFTPTAAMMKAVILAGGRQIFGDGDGASYYGAFPNPSQGWGWTCLEKSLYFAGEKHKLFVVDETTGLNTGESKTYYFSVKNSSKPLRVILTWTDYPAPSGANPALINDLDLTITAPNSKNYPGNLFLGFNPAYSVEGTTHSSVDNVEGVILPDSTHGLVAGQYTITVDAINVPNGPQDFAIAVVGNLDGIGSPDDETPPTLIAHSPSDGAQGLPGTTTVMLHFSEAIYPPSLPGGFSISPEINGSFDYVNSSSILFAPDIAFDFGKTYTVTLTSSITDMAENPLSGGSASFSFSIEAEPGFAFPSIPVTPSGPVEGYRDESYIFYTKSTDKDDHQQRYTFDWGDGTTTQTGYFAENTWASTTHTWESAGTYIVRVMATDETNLSSGWSDTLQIIVHDLPNTVTICGTSNGYIYLSTSEDRWEQHAQSFTATSDAVAGLQIGCARYSSCTRDLIVSIRESLTGSNLASFTIDETEITSTDRNNMEWVQGYFPSPVATTPGQTYYVIFKIQQIGKAYMYLGLQSGNPYAGGQFYNGSNSTWPPGSEFTPSPDHDAMLKIISEGDMPNIAPHVPQGISGPANGMAGVLLDYSVILRDHDDDQVLAGFDWGDGTFTNSALVNPDTAVTVSHSWPATGTYVVRARAIDETGLASPYGEGLTVNITGPDLDPPSISNVYISDIYASSAEISWTTDEASSSKVEYGTDPSLGMIATGLDDVTFHTVSIAGLSPDTRYYFKVISSDSGNNTGESSILYFDTPEADVSPPTISLLMVQKGTDTEVTITWHTDELADSHVEYGLTSLFGSTQNSLDKKLFHSVRLTGLMPGEEYHFRAISSDRSGNPGTSEDRTFALPAKTPWTIYHSYEGENSLVDYVHELANRYPDLVELGTLGSSWEGRSIYFVKISDNPSISEGEPQVLVDGGIHSKEWIATENALYIATALLDNYNFDTDITSLVNRREIWVIPMFNPDGRVKDAVNDGIDPASYLDWRKNLRDNNLNGTFGDTSDGVDLNRNFPLGWGTGASSSFSSDVYRGPSPLSEPESEGFENLVVANNFRVYLTLHSKAGKILYPWGYTTDVAPDEARLNSVAIRMASVMAGFLPMKASSLGVAGGCTDDWLYDVYSSNRAISYTVEATGALFRPLNDQILSHARTTYAGAVIAFKVADDPWNLNAPEIMNTNPVHLAADVPIDSVISVTFSEEMDRSATEGAFSIEPAFEGSFSWAGTILTFTPVRMFDMGTRYNVTIATTADDDWGTGISFPFEFSFTTLDSLSGNNRPVADIVIPTGTQSGNITISFTVSDVEGETVSIYAEYSEDGGVTWNEATLVSASGGTVDGGNITGLAATPTPVNYSLTWDSAADNVATGSLNSTVRIRVTPSDTANGNPAVTGNFTVDNVGPPPPKPIITTTALPGGIETVAYQAMFEATDGAPPYTWDRYTGSLPPGLMLASDGILFGIPTAAGDYSFTMRVMDTSDQQDIRSFNLHIEPGLIISILGVTQYILGQDASTEIRWRSNRDGTYTVRVGGDSKASGLEIDSGSITAGVDVTTTVTEADLPDKEVSVITIYVDGAGQESSAFLMLYDDQSPPNSRVDYPSREAVVGRLDSIRCSAEDPVSNTISSIQIALSDGTNFWDGDGFYSASMVWHDASTTRGSSEWVFDTSSINFPDGWYYVYSRGVDAVGNVETPDDGTKFRVLSGSPTVEFRSISSYVIGPSLKSTINWNVDYDGQYYIEVGGNGMPGTGSLLTEGPVTAGEIVSVSVMTTDLPINITSRIHIIAVNPLDKVGHVSVDISNDHTPPSSQISAPVTGEKYCSLQAFHGTAEDAGGSNVADVKFSLFNGSKYFEGKTFTGDGETWITATGTTDWSFNAKTIPLNPGIYTLRSRAADTVGNVELPSSEVTFEIKGETDELWIPYYLHEKNKKKKKSGFCAMTSGDNGPGDIFGTLLPVFMILAAIILLRMRDIISRKKTLLDRICNIKVKIGNPGLSVR